MGHIGEKGERMADAGKTNTEGRKEQDSACGVGCPCNIGSSGKMPWLIGAVVMAIAGVLVVRAVMKADSSRSQGADAAFALPEAQRAAADSAARAPVDKPQAAETAAPQESAASAPRENLQDKPAVCGEPIGSLGDLNSKALNKDGVFVFLAGQDDAKNREIAAVVEKGAAALRGRNISVGVFTLKGGSAEYANIVRQVPPPAVIAMVKGRGASAVTEDVTESRLVQAFVAAAVAGGCGPSGCGPSGCR